MLRSQQASAMLAADQSLMKKTCLLTLESVQLSKAIEYKDMGFGGKDNAAALRQPQHPRLRDTVTSATALIGRQMRYAD